MEIIRFKKSDSNYGYMSNFYPCNIEYEGINYINSEAMFQSFKTQDLKLRKEQFENVEPGLSKRRGRLIQLRSDWEEVKYECMKITLRNKFTQNKELKEKLLSTKDSILIEDTTSWHDNIWGDCSCVKCKNKEGRNLLGKALMEIREELKNI